MPRTLNYFSFSLLCLLLGMPIQQKSCNAEKVKMRILEEFGSEIIFGGNPYANLVSEETSLSLRMKPAPVTGPAHLKKLFGKCFEATVLNYKYKFCPFDNITQHEDTASGWNQYHGVLGVYQEWEIINNTFVAMWMRDGDVCGDKYRSTKVIFKCSTSNSISNVTEPSTCEYELILNTPFVCHRYSMLVYPMLTKEFQSRWDLLEDTRENNYLTNQGYEKGLKNIFLAAGFYLSEERRKILLKEKTTELENTNSHLSSHRFTGLEQCIEAYNTLEREVENLRNQINTLNNTCNKT